MNRSFFSIIAFALLIGSPTSAAQIGQFELRPDYKAIFFSGPIGDQTASDFDQALVAMPDVQALVLNSPGGQVVSALDIARKVNTLKLNTLVPEGSTCASACSMILLAGDGRHVEGRLGVHQLSSSQPSLNAVQRVLSAILDDFTTFGVDPRVTRHMLTTPQEEMYFFQETELTEYSINRKPRGEADGAPRSMGDMNGARFSDYPASVVYTGPAAKPKYVGEAARARNFRTRIREGLAAGPNFAGSWTLVEIGCGTSCRTVIPVDGITGKIVQFPLEGGETNYQMEITSISESNLVKTVWMDTANGEFDSCVKQDFMFDNGRFKLVWEHRYKVNRFGFCS